MFSFYRINLIGDIYVPTQFREIAPDNAPLKLFPNDDLGQFNRIFNHLRRGGVAVLSGEWVRITQVMEYVERKEQELSPPSSKRRRRQGGSVQKRGHRGMDAPKAGRSSPAKSRAQGLMRLMCWADKAGQLQVNPPPQLPYLLEWVGENPGANEDCPFLVPIHTLQNIQNALAEVHPVDALDTALVASENVLAPRSQETVECFQHGLRSVKAHLPSDATVLDMGCGCGCLTLLAAQELGEKRVNIYASDLLPEAVATTRLNIQRFLDSAPPQLPPIQVLPSGDLFQPVSSRRFELIIFNAPWVVSRARNRAEIAIHDEGQKTLRNFFQEAPRHLTAGGRILLGYADTSGTKAIDNLTAMVEDAGLMIVNRFKKRVATHRAKRKWENITVYELTSGM